MNSVRVLSSVFVVGQADKHTAVQTTAVVLLRWLASRRPDEMVTSLFEHQHLRVLCVKVKWLLTARAFICVAIWLAIHFQTCKQARTMRFKWASKIGLCKSKIGLVQISDSLVLRILSLAFVCQTTSKMYILFSWNFSCLILCVLCVLYNFYTKKQLVSYS